MKKATIDLGTNTCLLLIVDWDEDQKKINRVLEDRSTIVRLGQGVDVNRKLHPEAMERTRSCLKEYAQVIAAHGVIPSSVVAIATSQARDSENAADFFMLMQIETGIEFQILSGEQEARSSYLGALKDPNQEAVVIDIGGGSTELISKDSGKSIDMGSVRFTERFLKTDPVLDEEFWACRSEIDQELEKLTEWRKSLDEKISFVGVAGTVTTIAAWYLGLETFDREKLDSVVLQRGDVHRLVEELKWRSVPERIQMTGIEEKRADVLLAGAMILWRTMEVLSFSSCQVSTRGLRYGALFLSN